MAEIRGKSAKPPRRARPAIELPPLVSAAERKRVIRLRRFGIRSPYLALLLQAIRDGVVHDWASLTAFQRRHKLSLVDWATVQAGAPPPVERLLRQLQDAGLITMEGIDWRRYIRVRRDNFTKAPPGRIVFDPHQSDPDDILGSDPPQPTDDIKIRVSPRWADIQDALGISLGALARLQSPRARIVEPVIFPEPSAGSVYGDVFVIMPFKKGMRPIYDHIECACQALALSVGRASDFFKAHPEMADVWGLFNTQRS